MPFCSLYFRYNEFPLCTHQQQWRRLHNISLMKDSSSFFIFFFLLLKTRHSNRFEIHTRFKLPLLNAGESKLKTTISTNTHSDEVKKIILLAVHCSIHLSVKDADRERIKKKKKIDPNRLHGAIHSRFFSLSRVVAVTHAHRILFLFNSYFDLRSFFSLFLSIPLV